MCAIFGYKCYGPERPTLKELAVLGAEAESRGTDASGLAWPDKLGMAIVKAPIRAGIYLTEENLKRLFGEDGAETPRLMIGHTRMATQGRPEDEYNNHPVYSKVSGTALVHNGMITNDRSLSERLKLERVAEVDTEVLLRLWDMGQGDTEARLNRFRDEVYGSYAVALLSDHAPDTLTIFRHSNPCVFFWDDARKILFFASTTGIIRKAVSTAAGVQLGPIPWAVSRFVEMPDDSWVVFAGADPPKFGTSKSNYSYVRNGSPSPYSPYSAGSRDGIGRSYPYSQGCGSLGGDRLPGTKSGSTIGEEDTSSRTAPPLRGQVAPLAPITEGAPVRTKGHTASCKCGPCTIYQRYQRYIDRVAADTLRQRDEALNFTKPSSKHDVTCPCTDCDTKIWGEFDKRISKSR